MKLLLGDCLEKMRELPENSVDIILTSPPYNIGDMHSNRVKHGTYQNNNMNEFDYQKWQIKVLNECFRVLRDDGSMFYNHKVRIKEGLAIHPLKWIFDSKFLIKQELVWDQGKSANCDKIRFFPFSERIYWLVKDKKTKLFNCHNQSDVIRVVPTENRRQTGPAETVAAFDAIPQTLAVTAIGALGAGSAVNLEHAATASTYLGGHVVLGHVDGIAEVVGLATEGEWRVRVALPADLGRLAVDKGSIALDGVSLTIARVEDDAPVAGGRTVVDVCLIPETLARTTLAARVPGDALHVEMDHLAKLVARQVERWHATAARA